MNTKRANDITLLNNQIIILDAWNTWKCKTTENYDARINEANKNLEEKRNEAASLKKTIATLDFGRSLGALILIIICAACYIVPYFVDVIKPFSDYIALGTVILVIPYIFWARGTKKTFIAHLLYWLTNGLVFGGVLYFLSIRDGQPNLYYALFENPRFDQIIRMFWYLSLGAIVILVVSMIVRKIHYNNVSSKLNKLLFETNEDIIACEEEVNSLILERDQTLYNKEKEYFGKYPLVLPGYSISDVQKLLQYMINHRADTIKEAINLCKQDDALSNIQNDVKALRMMQEKTNEDLEKMRKEQEEKEKQQMVEEEKEDLVY